MDLDDLLDEHLWALKLVGAPEEIGEQPCLVVRRLQAALAQAQEDLHAERGNALLADRNVDKWARKYRAEIGRAHV